MCSSRVANQFLPHVQGGDIVVLHEMLHSLGPGENPPSAIEISRGVEARCEG